MSCLLRAEYPELRSHWKEREETMTHDEKYNPVVYQQGFDSGRIDWVRAARCEYAMACRTGSAGTYSGQYGRGYYDGWLYGKQNCKQLQSY